VAKYDAAPTVAAGLLRLARIKAGLTQQALADRAGIDQQVVSAYETGRREPTLPTLMRLIEAAGYELRFGLEPSSDHDLSLESYLDTLPAALRQALDEQARDRLEEARLRRVRGK
jgi:transcriptional regulator with XRE-family HTH domain